VFPLIFEEETSQIIREISMDVEMELISIPSLQISFEEEHYHEQVHVEALTIVSETAKSKQKIINLIKPEEA
jgi:hypothetical protein